MVSAIVSLLVEPDIPTCPPYFRNLGYQLLGLEVPMVDVHGRRYTPDLFITNLDRDNVILIDCKTWGPMIHNEQICRYLRTSKREVVSLTGISPRDVHVLTHDALFMVIEDAEPEIAAAITGCTKPRCDGVAIALVSDDKVQCSHNMLSDATLSDSLDKGWPLDLQSFALERLPYDLNSAAWEIADAIFQTVFSMWLSGVSEFTVDDLCEESNEWWQFLRAVHHPLRNRVREELRRIAKTALRSWIAPVRDPTNAITGWTFIRKPSQRKDVHDGFKRRQDRYILVRIQDIGVTVADFDDIERDQLALTAVDSETLEAVPLAAPSPPA